MSAATVTTLLGTVPRGAIPPTLIDDGHNTSITVTNVRRSGPNAATLVITGVIFRDGVEWVPRAGFWPVIFSNGKLTTLNDAMGAVIAAAGL